MASYPYFPGCALSTKAKALDICARESLKMVGFELKELENWTCCGAVFPLSEDEHIRLVSPVRALFEASKSSDKLVALCSACFNVLKRTEKLFRENETRRERVLNYMDEEVPENFSHNVKVIHFIDILAEDLTFPVLKEKVKRSLTGLKIAPYYDCLTFRPPKEMNYDDPENPRIFSNYLTALGATPVDFPFRTECCGAHLAVSDRDASLECSYKILKSASLAGAEAVMTACPLCHYNLDSRQYEMAERYPGFKPIPVFYLTQLLGVAMELSKDLLGFQKNKISPLPLLEEKGLI